jgi:hypothetical protein
MCRVSAFVLLAGSRASISRLLDEAGKEEDAVGALLEALADNEA